MKDAIVTLMVLGQITDDEATKVWAAVSDNPPFLDAAAEGRILADALGEVRSATKDGEDFKSGREMFGWSLSSRALSRIIKRAKAEAWDEGHSHCFRVENPHNPIKGNPYRATS
jgi:hypothetical protein